jgi:hypothetical protein
MKKNFRYLLFLHFLLSFLSFDSKAAVPHTFEVGEMVYELWNDPGFATIVEVLPDNKYKLSDGTSVSASLLYKILEQSSDDFYSVQDKVYLTKNNINQFTIIEFIAQTSQGNELAYIESPVNGQKAWIGFEHLMKSVESYNNYSINEEVVIKSNVGWFYELTIESIVLSQNGSYLYLFQNFNGGYTHLYTHLTLLKTQKNFDQFKINEQIYRKNINGIDKGLREITKIAIINEQSAYIKTNPVNDSTDFHYDIHFLGENNNNSIHKLIRNDSLSGFKSNEMIYHPLTQTLQKIKTLVKLSWPGSPVELLLQQSGLTKVNNVVKLIPEYGSLKVGDIVQEKISLPSIQKIVFIIPVTINGEPSALIVLEDRVFYTPDQVEELNCPSKDVKICGSIIVKL